MIDKMAESIFDVMLPFTIEQMSTAPMVGHLDMNDGNKFENLLSEDQWKKFEIDFPELSDVDDVFKELGCGSYGTYGSMGLEDHKDPSSVFLNHDCMWAGHCGSKEHAEESKYSMGCVIPKIPTIKKEMCPPPPMTANILSGQQSLLKPSVKAMGQSSSSTFNTNSMQRTPLTPPESDDEENKSHTSSLLKILNEAINECELNGDSDLTEYFEGREVEVKEEPLDIKEEVLDIKVEPEDTSTESEQEHEQDMDYQEFRMRTQMAAVNDHSYHKDKNAVMRLSNYGMDTPSDSEEEEEIDVVSVNEKFTNASRMALSLPNNPSSRDRHQLQRRVATAMSKKRSGGSGIKTILPVRSGIVDVAASSSSSSSSSSTTGRRGVKRGRGSRTNNGYKRRKTNMDAEREPTDKRHLHNDMERQRRVDLRIAFDNLKAVVPEVSGTKKIAKVNILLQAAQYCYYLTGANLNYTKQLDELKRKQVWLRSRVSQLRRNLAARR